MSAVLPIPQRMTCNGVLRSLSNSTLRIGGAPFDVTAIDDLARRAFGIRIVSDTADADVVLVTEAVDMRAPIGADPRPLRCAGLSEAHRIQPIEGRLTISGAGDEAFFRGLLTVLACLDGDQLPALEVHDYPRFAWRGLSLDVVRRWFPIEDVERVIDLLALHKMNVLHIHLTDSQAWRFAVPGRPTLTPDAEHYISEDLDALVAYARARHITIVPEFDVPGHVAATVGADGTVAMTSGGHPFMRYLDWDAPGVAEFVREVLAELAAHFDAPYLHVGGDEAFGAPHNTYVAFLQAAAAEVRSLGRRVIGWQEAIRADALDHADLVQLWISERDRFDEARVKATVAEELHPLVEQAAVLFAESVHDPARIGAAAIKSIISSSDPLYLDRRPSEQSLDEVQNARFESLGNAGYDATRSTDVLHWDPIMQKDIQDADVIVAGIEAALWCETVQDFDDVALLLLPRLALVAQRAWGAAEIDIDEVLATARAQDRRWSGLGFANFHRSTEVFE